MGTQKNNFSAKPVGNFILLKLDDDENDQFGEVVKIGSTVPDDLVHIGDRVFVSNEGPWFEKIVSSVTIEPNEKQPERNVYVFIDYRSIVSIDNDNILR